MKNIKKYISRFWLLAIIICLGSKTSNAQTGTLSFNNGGITTIKSCELIPYTGTYNINNPSGGTFNYAVVITSTDPKLTPATITVASGTATGASYSGTYGGTLNANGNIGTYKNCNVSYNAKLYINAVLVNTQTKNVILTATNKWTITKTLVGVTNVNTLRYKLQIYSPQCNGAYNLYNAIIQEVPGSGGVISWCSRSYSGLNINLPVLTVGNNYDTYVDIKYPCGLPVGTNVCNTAKLIGRGPANCGVSPLGAFETKTSTPVCTALPPFTMGQMPVVTKGLADPSRNNSPGCQNAYVITLTNGTTNTIGSLVATDLFPFNQVDIISAITCNIPGVTITYPSGGPTALPYPIGAGTITNAAPSNIVFTFPSTYLLQPNDVITISIPFKIKTTTPISTIVTNNVSFTGTAMSVYPTLSCPPFTSIPSYPISNVSASFPFTVQQAAPKPTLIKQVINGTNSTFAPGDVVKFRVCISNYGGASFVANFSDFIDPDVFNTPTNIKLYVDDDETYQCSIDAAHLVNIPGVITYNAITKRLVGAVTVPAQCKLNTYSNATIEYEAIVKANALPCKYFNEAAISGSWTGSPIKVRVNYYVKIQSLLSMKKLVDANNDGIFSTSESAAPGQMVKYKVVLENLSYVKLKNIKIIDNLPQGPDINLFDGSARNPAGTPRVSVSGMFGQTTTSTGVSPTGVTTFSSATPAPYPASCTPYSSTVGNAKSVMVNYGSNVLDPGEIWTMTFNAQVETGTSLGINYNNALICSEVDYGTGPLPVTCETPITGNPALEPTITPWAILDVSKFEPLCCTAFTFNATLQSENITLGAIGTIWAPTINVQYSGLPTRKFKVSVEDVNITYPMAECARDFTSYKTLGTISRLNCNPVVGGLNKNNSIVYAPYVPSNLSREIIYDNALPGSSATSFNIPGQTVQLNIRLPKVRAIDCCNATAIVRLKFSFEDNNCNVCEYIREYIVPISSH